MKKYFSRSKLNRLSAFMLMLSLCAGLWLSCNKQPIAPNDTTQSSLVTSLSKTTVPAQGTSTTLDFATWNLEWFGDTENGPSDEALQLENVHHIISGLDMDLWSVQEVTNVPHFANLVSQLTGYDGFLANDPLVTDGAAYYSDFDDNELKVGIIYKTAVATVQSAKVILKEYDYEFAGRPPVEVQLSVSVDGTSLDLVMILLHAKAGSRHNDWERRNTASAALKSYLDSTYPTTSVMVIGDFNDDVDQSITRPKDSPYKNFVDDAANYTFPTKELSDAGISSTVYYSDMIDHHLSTDDLIASYLDGSVQVFPADQYLDDYAQTTSDHYPVLSNFSLSGGSTNSPPTADFSYTTTDLTAYFADLSTDSDGSITAWAWDFGDGNTSTAQNPSHAYAASGTYAVSLTVTDDDGAADATSKDVTVSSSTTNNPPTADFTYTTIDLTANFTDQSTDSDGSVVGWSWNFGDGNTSTSQNPSHTYAAAGTYTVSLTVTDDDGATDATSQDVTVSSSSGGITLTATGYKVRGSQKVDLEWSGAAGTTVDVYRDGVKITTTENDGFYTDNIGNVGGGSYTYQIFDGTTWSNQATVTF